MLPEFEKQWAKMGLNDKDLRRLQYELLADPKAGDVMQGTGGLREWLLKSFHGAFSYGFSCT